MKSLWPVSFEQALIATPKNVIEEQAGLLPKLTGDIVYAEVVEIVDGKKGNYDFAYRFIIRGKFLENYSFSIFTLRHNIILYPVEFIVGEELNKEIEGLDWNGSIKLNGQEELEEMLEKVFKSERIQKVVGAIMALSK